MANGFAHFLTHRFHFVFAVIFIFSINVCFSAYCGNRLYLTYISSQESNGCKSVNQTFSECNSLDDAITTSSFNNSCFFIDSMDNVKLSVNFTLINVHGFTLHGKSEELTIITCSNYDNVSSNGILVAESSDILFSSFSLRSCGLHRNVTTFRIDKELPIVSSAIFYEAVENIFIENVEVFESGGYGITLFNPKIRCIFNNVVVSRSIAKLAGNYWFLGGVYLDISNNDSVSIMFNKTKFQLNSMVDDKNCRSFESKTIYETENVCNDIISIRKQGKYLYTPVKKGGGISIFFRNASNKIINFTDSSINNNKACFGGGLYLYFSKNTLNNLINFNGGSILSNSANILGGGVCVINQASSKSNHISFLNVTINSNSACIGGGVGLDQLSITKISFSFTSFDSNKADIGSSLQVHNANISFTDVYIKNSRKLSEFSDGQGAIHATNSSLFFCGNNLITQNENTAFVLDSTLLHNQDVLKFIDNSGYQGGAVGLYGESYIFFGINAIFLFENNTASKRGGAVFILVPGFFEQPPSILSNRICFFHVAENFTGKVTFLGNKAGTGFGNHIFTSTLEACRNKNTEINKTENFIDVITKWPHFYFDKSSQIISTNAIKIVIPEEWNVQPGLLFKPEIILKDEREQIVDEEVYLSFQDKRFYVDLRQIIQNRTASFRLYGPPKVKAKLFIQSASCMLSLDFQLNDCGFGFMFNGNACICNDNPEFRCFDDSIYIPVEQWTYIKEIYPCPKGYCRECLKEDSYVGNLCKLHESNQCAKNRNQSSILCSRCNAGYSVVYGSSDCKNCTGESFKAVQISVIICIVVAIFNLFLLLLNSKTFSWYLVPTIYSYQILDTYQILDKLFHTKKALLSLFFIELFNSVGIYRNYGFEFCFYDNMNDLAKKDLLFCVAVWWMLSLFFVYMISSFFFSRIFTKEAFYRSLIIVLFIVYSITAKLSFEVLQSITINSEKKVLIFAEQQYLKETRHKIMFAIAVLVIIVFLISFPLLILCSSLYVNLFSKNNCFKSFFMKVKIKEFLKYYQYGLKPANNAAHDPANDTDNDTANGTVNDTESYFPIFYFLARVLLLIADQFSSSEIQQTSLSASCLCVLVIFLLLKPFLQTYHNVFHTLQLTNLFLVALWNDTYRWMYLDDEDQEKFKFFFGFLLFIPTAMTFFEVVKSILKHTGVLAKFRSHSDNDKIRLPDRVTNKFNYSGFSTNNSEDNSEDWMASTLSCNGKITSLVASTLSCNVEKTFCTNDNVISFQNLNKWFNM